MAKSDPFLGKEWATCPICTGRFVTNGSTTGRAYTLTVGAGKVPICAWCHTRGGKFMILFIQFVEQFGKKCCERGLVITGVSCKCPPCTARRILQYRNKLVGHQVSPVKV